MGQSFRELVVWQRSIQMTVAVYKLTEDFPQREIYGLSSPLRRASVSVASNIAEGYGGKSAGEHRQFLGIARGSNAEVQTQLVIARELNFGNHDNLEKATNLAAGVGEMLTVMVRNV